MKCQCGAPAEWYYVPDEPYQKWFCDACVPRQPNGCSCNMLEDGTMPLDGLGRHLPCIEFDWVEELP